MTQASSRPRPYRRSAPAFSGPAGAGRKGKKISLAAHARREIRDRILRGDLPVGAVLSRRRLARELKISVPPVSEALQSLERDGLVESRPRVGTRVRVPGRQDVEDRAQVREALESQSARLAAERATPAEKQELRQMGRRVDRRYAEYERSGGDREVLFSANTDHMQLHLRIAEFARCAALRDAIEKEQVLIFNWLYDTAVERRTLASDYHSRLTDAIASGKAVQADAAMREHIRFGLKEVLDRLPELTGTATGWRPRRSRGIRMAAKNQPAR